MPKETMDQILFYVQITLGITSILSLIALVIYVIKTWNIATATQKAAVASEKTLLEMKASRDEEVAPYVIVYFDLEADKPTADLVIKNIGKTLATDVNFVFTPPLENIQGKLDHLYIFNKGIRALPPGYEIRFIYNSKTDFPEPPTFPLTYEVEVSYLGGLNQKKRTLKYTLDLVFYNGLTNVKQDGLHELNAKMKDLVKFQESISKATNLIQETLANGLIIRNSILTTNIGSRPELWKYQVIAKLLEFKNLWDLSTRKDTTNSFNTPVSELTIMFSQIAEHLTTLISYIPLGESEELEKEVRKFISTISELSKFTFPLDGGQKRKEFKKLGDNCSKEIENFKSQWHHTNNNSLEKKIENPKSFLNFIHKFKSLSK